MPNVCRITVCVLCQVATLIASAQVTCALENRSTAREKELIQTLRTGEPAERALACKQLAIYGGKDACPHLAPLLTDPQLASWARIALEAIPDPAADGALRTALDSLHGSLAVGVINSIGVRGDAAAVDQLIARLGDKEAAVASAAAVALGHIGSPPAVAALREALPDAPDGVRSSVAEGYLLCAHRALAGGYPQEAAKIFDEVRAAAVPEPRKLEATRGAILARGNDGIPLLVEQINSPHPKDFQLALTIIREFPGKKVATDIAAQLRQVPPARAALLLYALADRNDRNIPTAVLAAAKSSDEPVRIAAISFLGRRGNATHLPLLLEIAAEDNPAIAGAAKEAITTLPGQDINGEIVARLPDAPGESRVVLIESVGRRRIEAIPHLMKALDAPDPAVRAAALCALGETIGSDQLHVLIAQVTSPQNSSDVNAAVAALHTAAVRMPDRDACAAAIADAIPAAQTATKVSLLKILGSIGGPKALESIDAAMQQGDDPIRDAGSRLLGEWMTADAAPVLLKQATCDWSDKYRIRALRGYIRIARQFQMPLGERAAMCSAALAAARRPEEQKLVLQVLERYPSLQTLQVAIDATENPVLNADARRTALEIASKVDDTDKAKHLLGKIGLTIQP